MNTAEDIWGKLAKSKKYREEFALALLKRSVAFQIKTLRKKHCGSQAALAERASLTQGVVSRAEDQDYGNLTFNTVGRIAGGLDMAFIGRFVSFGDLARFSSDLSEKEFTSIPTFEEETERRASGVASAASTMTAYAVIDSVLAASDAVSQQIAGSDHSQSKPLQSAPIDIENGRAMIRALCQTEPGSQSARSNVIPWPLDNQRRQGHAAIGGNTR
ncbi:MAG TPA: hypothetical protein VGZ29_09215 [Terriglobia bacterium]|nr:hypothetical protein [Terriglobia bacterium]